MKMQRYRMAHSCPNCGLKDSEDAWSGARMLSSEWGHDFLCCSDACGFEFAKIVNKKSATKEGRKELRKLWDRLQDESDARLGGEPYRGYEAENILRSLGR